RRAIALEPGNAEAYNSLATALKNLGRMDEAIAGCRKAIAIRPDFAEAHNNLGLAYHAQGKLNEAIACYHQATSIKPDYAEAHCNWGAVLQLQNKPEPAAACFRMALSVRPDLVTAHYNLGIALCAQCNLEEALVSFNKALSLKPDYADAYTNLLFTCAYHSLLTPDEYLAQARGWELACVPEQERLAARNKKLGRVQLAGRRLRVGYISGDFRQHAVSYFVEQLFAHHDRSRVEIFAYATHTQEDAVTERLKVLADYWVPVMGLANVALLDRIEADGIDVLIDLSGHTGHNRMGIFARRAAPVQAHYLGYCASTGLTEMDYWIGDAILTPPKTDGHFCEQVWRLPRVWVSYDGQESAPLTGWQPAQDGTVWLGSFNNLGKLTPATFALWAKVLHALPEGKLLLKTKGLSDAGNRQRILDTMSGHGIALDRIELQASDLTPGWAEHMAYYDRLDIALDPVGAMGGGTTTCDALWMGVPVVALEGDRMASRMTASMLNAIGHAEWVAQTEADYIDKIVALARDVKLRLSLRSGQRERMAASALCDAKGLAACLEDAYVEMFGRWWQSPGK
ncbi:MAG: tetratricopeptide repeat protein, partial [Gammaproteobacteria bacterium]|nr:tetratricopeptide repeat protein [Gammaproteobacteria bacterium]